jgi:hypothetical protein
MATPPSSTPSSATPATPPVAANPVKAADPKSNAPVGKTEAPVSKAPVTAEEFWDVQENGQTIKKSKKDILEAYQLRQLSDKKRSEAEKQMSEYTKLFSVLKQDPVKFMRAAGVDFDNLSASYLAKKAEEAMKDPKDVALAKAKEEAETYKKWIEEQKTKQENDSKTAAIEAERSKIHQEIIEAVQEKSQELGLPIDEDLIIAVAQQMMIQDKAKKPLNAKEALPHAYQKTQKWLQGMASKMEGEHLVKWLGDDVAKKIRKYDLMQLKSKRAATAPQAQSAVKPQSGDKAEKASKPRNWSDFKKELDEKYHH